MSFQWTTRSCVVAIAALSLLAGCDEPDPPIDAQGISVAEFEEATKDFGDCSETPDECSWLGASSPCVCGMALTRDHHTMFQSLSSSVICDESEHMSCEALGETYCKDGVCIAPTAAQ